MRFKLGTDPDAAAGDVRDRVSRVRGKLPDAVDEPVIAKVEADAHATIWLAFTSDDLSPLEVTDLVNRFVKPPAADVPGVADVRDLRRPALLDAHLARSRAARRLPPDRAGRRGRAAPAEPRDSRPGASKAGSANSASPRAPTSKRPRNSIRSSSRMSTASPCVCATSRTSSWGPQDERTHDPVNGLPAILGVIKRDRQSARNFARAAQGHAQADRDLPTGMKATIAYDNSVFIDRSIDAVYSTIAEAVVLVVAGDLLLSAHAARVDHPDGDDPRQPDRRFRADGRCSASPSTR